MGNIGPNFNSPRQPMQQPGSARPAGATPDAQAVPGQGSMQASGAGQNLSNAVAADLRQILAPLFAFQNALNAQEAVMLLRNLLRMPQEIVQLMALLASVDGEGTQEILKQLLAENPMIPLEELQQLLLTNGAKSQDKLLKLLQSSQMTMSGSGRQIGDLLSTMGELVNKAAKSPTEALHSTIALYLPYFPLEGPQRFFMQFEPAEGEGGEEGGDEAHLVLFIETLSLGLFRITLSVDGPGALQILFDHDSAADAVIPEIERQATSSLASEGFPSTELLFNRRSASPLAQKADKTGSILSVGGPQTGPADHGASEQRQAVGIHPSGGVSVRTIHAAYVLIRVIFDIDNRQALNTQRSGMLPER